MLRTLLNSHRASAVLAAAVDLGVIESLRDAPLDVDAIARASGLAPAPLRRLLRALCGLHAVTLDVDRVALTTAGRELLSGAPAFDQALLTAREYLPAWTRLAQGVATGTAVAIAAFGSSTWAHRAMHPELAASFARATAENQDATAVALAAIPALAACRTWVDVGGGAGALLIALLRELPDATGMVLETDAFAALAQSAVAAAGLADRCRVDTGSFFERVPEHADAYVLSHVLHDWDDARAGELLARCRAAMTSAARLIVIEHLLTDDGDVPLELALLDLHMLVMHGGRERTRAEYSALLAGAGLVLRDVVHLRGTLHALVAGVA